MLVEYLIMLVEYLIILVEYLIMLVEYLIILVEYLIMLVEYLIILVEYLIMLEEYLKMLVKYLRDKDLCVRSNEVRHSCTVRFGYGWVQFGKLNSFFRFGSGSVRLEIPSSVGNAVGLRCKKTLL